MLSQLELFNESRKNQGLASIEIGIGINTGEVVAGNIGSHDRMEYTVIGEAVNIASRIESLSKNYQTKLLITEATYGQIKTVSDFVCQKLDLVKVKGISRDIQIYGVAI
jgi:class 3 adenylate cyclase